MSFELSDVPLRSSSFTLKNRRLLWARARLYVDRLELTGWSLSGRYHRCIPLSSVDEIERAETHLVLHLIDGSSHQLGIEALEEWATAITTTRDVYEPPE